jgi:hypothetical protein
LHPQTALAKSRLIVIVLASAMALTISLDTRPAVASTCYSEQATATMTGKLVTINWENANGQQLKGTVFQSNTPVCFDGQRYRKFTILNLDDIRRNRTLRLTGTLGSSPNGNYSQPVFIEVASYKYR